MKFFKWQLNSKVFPYPIIFPFAAKSKMVAWKGLTGATGNLYCGLHEFEDMAFVLHFLRETDLLIDIGANVGSYTLLGSSEIGAKSISIEPIPETFKVLKLNVQLNNISDKVEIMNIGMGSEKGILKFTKSKDTTNHVATTNDTNTIEVIIEKFDDIIQIDRPTLVKIDVEGFENEVIKGMTGAITNEHLKVIIIELNGSGKRYGFSDDEIHKYLLSKEFKPFKYEPFNRQIVPVEHYGNVNTLYIKDLEFVFERISASEKIKIHGHEF